MTGFGFKELCISPSMLPRDGRQRALRLRESLPGMEGAGRGVNRNLPVGSTLSLGRSPRALLKLLSHLPRPPHRHHAPVPGEWGLRGSGPAVALSFRGPGSAVHGSGLGARTGRRPLGVAPAAFLQPPPESFGLCQGLCAVLQVPKTLRCQRDWCVFKTPLL